MFRRRNQLKPHHRLREFLWPSIGFKRSLAYIGHRLGRMPGSASSLAAGFAFGAAVSFTPFIGFHFLLAGLLAWIFRANILASALGTVVGNPWTFPFMWAFLYHCGRWMLGRGGEAQAQSGAHPHDLEGIWHRLMEGGWDASSEVFFDVLLPMIVASIPTAVVVWFLFYYPLRGLIQSYQARRMERMQRRAVERKLASESGGGLNGSEI